MITLTPKAADKVREKQAEEGLGEPTLRVAVRGGGCSGFTYDLLFEDETSETDLRFESHGIAIFVDMMSSMYLEGTEIDFVEGYGLGEGAFKFLNPQAKSTCGCGSSFSA